MKTSKIEGIDLHERPFGPEPMSGARCRLVSEVLP
jgi:hypothetical protein